MFMKLFTNIKIGKRLAIGFGITLALMLLMAIMGIYYLTDITNKLERIVLVNNAKTKCANDIRTAFSDITFLIGELVTNEDSSKREQIKKKIDEIRTNYKAATENLEKLEINEEGKTLIAKIKEKVAAGRDANNNVIDLAMSGNTKEASQKYAELTEITKGYIGAANDIVQYNGKRIQFRYEEAKRSSLMDVLSFWPLGSRTFLSVCFSLVPLHGALPYQSYALPLT